MAVGAAAPISPAENSTPDGRSGSLPGTMLRMIEKDGRGVSAPRPPARRTGRWPARAAHLSARLGGNQAGCPAEAGTRFSALIGLLVELYKEAELRRKPANPWSRDHRTRRRQREGAPAIVGPGPCQWRVGDEGAAGVGVNSLLHA